MSSDLTVRLRDVGKTYILEHVAERQSTFAETVLNRITRPRVPRTRERFQALEAVSFDVSRGEVVGIIGRNGAGKSTLLKILSRITAPSVGSVEVFGRLGSLLEVGTGFHPELSGRENIFLNGTILGMRRREVQASFDEIVAFAGVERFLDTPVKRYSSGMYVRLAFAVAAHLRTDILLIDEVLAVGDADFQKRCLGKMESLASEGRTVLFVSHSLETVSRLCNRTLLLSNGRVVADGPSYEVINIYASDPNMSGASRTWERGDEPGDESATLVSISVSTRGDEATSTIDIRDPVTIRVRARYAPGIVPPLVSVLVKDVRGTLLFSTNSTHALVPSESQELTWGCIVPGNFFAEGWHLITVMMNTHQVVHAYVEDVVSFNVLDRGEGDSVRGLYAGEWGGLVRPMLDWTVESEARSE